MLDATTLDGSDTILAPAPLSSALPVATDVVAQPATEGDDGQARDEGDPQPAVIDAPSEADADESLILKVMPATFDVMDAAERRLDSLPPRPERLARATAHAGALLVRNGVEPGSQRLERLAALIANGVCDHDDADDDEEDAEPTPAPAPESDAELDAEPPTAEELALAVRIGKQNVAQALAALATASDEEQGAILRRIERLRDSVAGLERLIPGRSPVAPETSFPALNAIAPAVDRPRLIVPALVAGAGLALIGAAGVLAFGPRRRA